MQSMIPDPFYLGSPFQIEHPAARARTGNGKKGRHLQLEGREQGTGPKPYGCSRIKVREHSGTADTVATFNRKGPKPKPCRLRKAGTHKGADITRFPPSLALSQADVVVGGPA